MTAPTKRRDEFTQGDTVEYAYTVTDADGAVFDLSAWTVAASLRPTAGGAATDATVTVTDAAAGEVTVRFAPADTAGLDGTYLYDAQVSDGTDVHTFDAAVLTFRTEVTT